jgi:hypothetical protein
MEHATLAANPFALMIDPAAVVMAMEKSDRLSRLQSRICRPLDKIVGTPADDESGEPEIVVDGFELEVR